MRPNLVLMVLDYISLMHKRAYISIAWTVNWKKQWKHSWLLK